MKLWMVFAALALSVVLVRGAVWAFPDALDTRAQVEWLADSIIFAKA